MRRMLFLARAEVLHVVRDRATLAQVLVLPVLQLLILSNAATFSIKDTPTYIVDFECRRSRVIVEVDGAQHGFDMNRERDHMRDEKLSVAGYKVLRFSNPEIDRELNAVMEAIASALNAHPTRLIAARFATLPFGEG